MSKARISTEAGFAEAFASAAPESLTEGRIRVGSFASGSEIGLPFVILKGRNPGPCLWISGQVHGNEINGIWAGLDFIEALDTGTLSGSVVLTPTANPLALDARRKTAPQDEQDLDQTFPGNLNGLVADQMSAALFDAAAAHADVLISMHTMNNLFNSDPYAVYKLHPDGGVGEEKLFSMIRHFRPAVACRMAVKAGAGELPGNIPGAIDYQMLSRGKPAFMVELGSGSETNAECIRQGVAGLYGVAAEMGLLSAPMRDPAPTLRRVTRRTHVMSREGGLFRTPLVPATTVAAGDPLGTICTLTGRLITEPAMEQDVLIIGIRKDPVVHTGDRIAFVALEWSDVSV
ncbi:M14 family metallopeptidase [Amorphus sp. 3PC139-8]|uniref:M14 family metallopeptidase n=1 Tax=Amorphus sp. 3PC139-8 TaxID=2735676 RepID=UPI00345D3A26